MQQDQRLAFAALNVVEANTFYFDEFPRWRVVTLAFFATKRLTSAEIASAATTTAAPTATGCGVVFPCEARWRATDDGFFRWREGIIQNPICLRARRVFDRLTTAANRRSQNYLR